VLGRAAGDEGKMMKENATRVGKMMKAALEEGGSAHNALLKFGEYV